jgi:hypothetical protein
VRLFFHPVNELCLGIAGGDSGQLLEAAALFTEKTVELLLALAECLFAAHEAFGAAGGLTLALLEEIVFAIELSFAVGDAALLAFYLFTAAAELDFPFFTKSNQLFLSAEDGDLAEAFGFALRFPDDSLGCLFGCRVGLLLAAQLSAPSKPSADKEKNRAGNYEQNYAGCG